MRAIEKARGLDCDVVIFDLEDAVAPDLKALARDQAVAAARSGGFGRSELVVRVNYLDTAWGADDLAAVAAAPFDGILLPKIGGAEDLDRVVDHCASVRSLNLWAMVETAVALFQLPAIAQRVACLVTGTNDLSLEIGARLDRGRTHYLGYLQQIIASARAAGCAVLDGVFNDLEDGEGFLEEARQAHAMGFDGKTLIHPNQISGCHKAFAPSAADVRWAGMVAEAFARPDNAMLGAIRIEGRMVERLHLAQAQRVLAWQGAAGG